MGIGLQLIIGITGTLGAGKGTIVEYMKNKGFKHFSAREDVINKEILRRELPITRDNMVLIGNNLREKNSPSYVAEKLFEMAQESGDNCILESLRTAGEIESLRKKGKFYLFAIDADQRRRYERIVKRKNMDSDDVDFEKFKIQEETEMKSTDSTKQNLSKCISMADFVFDNNGKIEDLHKQIDEVLKKIMVN